MTRDPACGMAAADAELGYACAGRRFRFCPEACRSEFEEALRRPLGAARPQEHTGERAREGRS